MRVLYFENKTRLEIPDITNVMSVGLHKIFSLSSQIFCQNCNINTHHLWPTVCSFLTVPGFFIPGFPKLQRFQAHHELILSKMLPKLKKHLVRTSVHEKDMKQQAIYLGHFSSSFIHLCCKRPPVQNFTVSDRVKTILEARFVTE